MSLQELTRPGGDDPPKRNLRILRKLREQEFPAPLTVRRFDSLLPALPKFTDVPVLGASIPLLGASIGDILDIPYSALEGATNTILKSLGVGVTEEEIVGVMAAGSKVRDVADVTIPLSVLSEAGVELTEDEQRVRNFARFIVSGASVIENLGSGGLHKAYETGAIAPPENEREQVADLAGQVLADIGVTLPFIPMMAVMAGAGVAKVAGSTIGRGIRGSRLIPGIPRAMGGKGLLRTFDAFQAKVVEKYGGAIGMRECDRLREEGRQQV